MKNLVSSGFVAVVVSAALATGCSAPDDSLDSSSSELSSPGAVTSAAVAKAQESLSRAQSSYALLKAHPPLQGTWSGTGSFTRPTRTSIFQWYPGGEYITHDENFFALRASGAAFAYGGKRWTGTWPAGAVNASATDVLSVTGTIGSWDVYQSKAPKKFIRADTVSSLTVDLKQVQNPVAYDVAVALFGASMKLTIYGPEGLQQYAKETGRAGGTATIEQDIDADFLEPSYTDASGGFQRVRDANGCVKKYTVRVKWSVPEADVSATTVAGATLQTPITTVCN